MVPFVVGQMEHSGGPTGQGSSDALVVSGGGDIKLSKLPAVASNPRSSMKLHQTPQQRQTEKHQPPQMSCLSVY
eukprot:CAMPEP_0168727744 /NCGR_PEP_ID=MMETSP0724-20121128/5331_1 /TAXON_ID=265536 /ORGANISM="Amphiprora sp., Strain CCMP467" /LENGTH=73 /DNA_ID=CAMNT_0008774577 /DNA_START=297 /DNA_END=515 /DNA_ORIENTATION=+